MKKYLVLYYSNTGNSEFIAKKISQELVCDSKKIIPIINNVFLLFLMSALKINIPVNISKKEIENYDEIIILGPIWGGLLISPLKTIILKCIKAEKNIHFAVTCETKDENKNDKYGYTNTLKYVECIGGKLIKNTDGFSTFSVNSTNKSANQKILQKIKITEDNFIGELSSKVENFVIKIKSS